MYIHSWETTMSLKNVGLWKKGKKGDGVGNPAGS